MGHGKGAPKLEPDTPLNTAAHRALKDRLRTIIESLPAALHEAEKDIENVHRLRVATRRAGAAISEFSVCLPRRDRSHLTKRVRRLRRAAGEARDWDVFMAWLRERRESGGDAERAGLDFLLGYSQGRRLAAQNHLVKVAAKKRFEKSWEESLEHVRIPKSHPELETLGDLVAVRLSKLLDRLKEAMNEDLDDDNRLHHVRIQGKRLRYAIEMFSEACPSRLRKELYPAIVEMQEILGRGNDARVAIQRLDEVNEFVSPSDLSRIRPAIESLGREQEERIARHRLAFQDWRQTWLKLLL